MTSDMKLDWAETTLATNGKFDLKQNLLEIQILEAFLSRFSDLFTRKRKNKARNVEGK